MDRWTDKPSAVTLAAHARRGLIAKKIVHTKTDIHTKTLKTVGAKTSVDANTNVARYK